MNAKHVNDIASGVPARGGAALDAAITLINYIFVSVMLAVGLGLVCLNFLPSMMIVESNPNFRAIFMLDLLAGCIFVGWVVAMVWAAKVDKPQTGQPKMQR